MFHSKCFYLSILLHVLQPTRFNLSIYLSIYPSKIVSHTTRFYCLSIYVYFTQSVSMYLSILLRVFHSTYLGVLIYLSFYDCVSLCSHNLSPDVSERASECDPANWKKRQNRKLISKFDAGGGSCQQLPHAHHHTDTLTNQSFATSARFQKTCNFLPPSRSISSTQRWTWINR